MDAQTTILRACGHPTHPSRVCEVDMGKGERLRVCADCYNASVAARRAERKAYLATLDRCAVPGCTRRATIAINGLDICGTHRRRVSKAHAANCARLGSICLFLPITYSRADYLRMAQGKGA